MGLIGPSGVRITWQANSRNRNSIWSPSIILQRIFITKSRQIEQELGVFKSSTQVNPHGSALCGNVLNRRCRSNSFRAIIRISSKIKVKYQTFLTLSPHQALRLRLVSMCLPTKYGLGEQEYPQSISRLGHCLYPATVQCFTVFTIGSTLVPNFLMPRC